MKVSDHVVATNIDPSNVIDDLLAINEGYDVSCHVTNRYNKTRPFGIVVEAEAEQ
jgi:hypothetical protein